MTNRVRPKGWPKDWDQGFYEDSAPVPSEAHSDAVTIARWIVGWWPGLEDDIEWGDDVDNHPVLLAAKRIMQRSTSVGS